MRRRVGLPTQFLRDALRQRRLRGRFAVHQVRHLRRPCEAGHPLHDLRCVGVSRHRVDLLDARVDVDEPAVHLHLRHAVDQLASARAPRLIADKQDRVAPTGQRRAQIVQYASTGGHPTRGDDDGGLGGYRQVLRLLRGGHAGEATGHEPGQLAAVLHELRIQLARPVAIKRQRFGGHRAVQIDRQDRNPLLVLELLDPVEHFFDAANREGGDDHASVGCRGVLDDARQALAVVVELMDAVAVGGLDQQHVGCWDRSWILQHRAVVPSQVSSKHDPSSALQRHLYGRRPQQVPHRHEADLDAGHHGDRTVVAKRLELRDRPPCVGDRVEGQSRMMARIAVAIGLTSIFLLQMGRVGQYQTGQVQGPRGAEHAPAKALRHQAGQIADMVQMRVGQDNGVDVFGGHRQVGPVAQAELLVALKQPGVDQHLVRAGVDQVFGTGDRLRRAEEGQGGHRVTIPAFGFQPSAFSPKAEDRGPKAALSCIACTFVRPSCGGLE